MKTSLRIASLALLGAALASGQATADVAQHNLATGHTNITPSRPVDGSLLEWALPSAGHVGTPYSYKPGNGAAELLSDPVVFDQSPTDLTLGGYYSDAIPGQFYSQKMFDNFTVGGAGVVGLTTVEWWGSSEFFSFPDYTNMDSFTVEIYADAGGVPGALLHSETVATAGTSPVVVGTSFSGADVYHQYLDLSATVPASTGDAMWLSIGATLFDGFGDAWVWASATGDGVLGADFYDGFGPQVFTGIEPNVGFVVHGVVPEPSTIALGSFGLMALAFAALRRKV
jgi:hypothetical protein